MRRLEENRIGPSTAKIFATRRPTLNSERLPEHGAQRPTLNAQLKIKREELDTLPFSSFRVENDMFFCRPVFGWREGIQHLQRIASLLESARNYPVDLLFVNWRWRSRPFHLLFSDRRPQRLRACRGRERKQD